MNFKCFTLSLLQKGCTLALPPPPPQKKIKKPKKKKKQHKNTHAFVFYKVQLSVLTAI